MIPMQRMMHNELHVFAYSQEMDQLMLANNVINNEEEEPRSSTYLEEGMIIEIDDNEETMPRPTPRSKVGSIDVNMRPQRLILCNTSGAEFEDAIKIHSKWNLKTKQIVESI